jgi:hypothetical protein
MVGFLKIDHLDLALSRRIFAGNCQEETAAAGSGAPQRDNVYFFYCLVTLANGRSGGGYRLTIKRGCQRPDLEPDSDTPRGDC